jgi:hypothetical protein
MPGPRSQPCPQHCPSGPGFPWGLALIVAGAVIVLTSAAFGQVMHDLMIIILAACGAVTLAALGGLALWLRHVRAMARLSQPVTLRTTARLEPNPAWLAALGSQEAAALRSEPGRAVLPPARTREPAALPARPGQYVPRRPR